MILSQWSYIKSLLFQGFTFRMVPSVLLGAALSSVFSWRQEGRRSGGKAQSPACHVEEAGVLTTLLACTHPLTPPL